MVEGDVAPGPHRTPALAVPTLHPSGGGLGYVSRLVRRVLVDACGEIPVLQLRREPDDGRVHPAEALRFVQRAIRAQLIARPDFWVATHLGLARFALRLPASARRPYVVVLHGPEIWDGELSPDRRLALQGAALRIATSAHTATRIQHLHPDCGSIEVCPVGLLPDTPRPGREAWGGSHPEPAALDTVAPLSVLAFSGPRDDLMVAAWERLAQRVPDAQLVLVGGAGRAAAADTSPSVLRFPHVPDSQLRALRARVAVFAGSASILRAVEAMAAGIPAVVPADTPASDVIAPNETGFVIRPGDPDALADALTALLQDDALRRTMGDAARSSFNARHTYAHFSANLLELLQPLLHP